VDIATKICNQLSYSSDTGVITWKQQGRGRRKNLVAGCIKSKKGNVWRRIVIDGQEYTGAQVAWTIKTGTFPAFIVDHIDGDSLNDAWCNLRRGDGCVDQRNCRMSSRNNTGVTGVKLSNGYYVAYIGDGNRQKYLGSSKDFFEIVCIRKRAEIELNYSPRHGL
jgi:hypothetical protein